MKEKLKNKKILGIGCVIIVVCIIIGYLVYSDNRRKEILSSMNIIFNKETIEIEYGTKDYDINKEIIKEVQNATIKEMPSIDTSKIGEQTLNFLLENEDLSKDFELKVNIVDTQKPEIKIKENNIELTVGDEFDINSNIESITDKIDGEIKINKDAKDINKKATEKYNKLSDEEKTKVDTILVDKLKISDFKIEDIKDKKEKNLYLKNCYFIEGSVDTSKAEEYTIKLFATDKNGLNSEKEFKVTVKEPVKEETPVSANVNSNNGSGSGTWAETTPNDANQSASVPQPQEPVNQPKGKEWAINYALSMEGQTGWDCGAFASHVFQQAGYLSEGVGILPGVDFDWQNIGYGDVFAIQRPNGTTHVMIALGSPSIDEYGNYTWTVVHGGNGGSKIVQVGTYQYSPSLSQSTFIAIHRY